MKINVIMPMLGEGSRMKGLQGTIKPLMALPDGDLFFIKALSSLKEYEIDNLVLVVREEYAKEFMNMRIKLSKSCNRLCIISNKTTQSHYESFCIGFNALRDYAPTEYCQESLVVLDCDIYAPLPLFTDFCTAGLFTFRDLSDEANKSYVSTIGSKAIQIAEKERISGDAVFGAYLFNDVQLLEEIVDELKCLRNMSDVYKILLLRGDKVRIKMVENVMMYGTKEEFVRIETI